MKKILAQLLFVTLMVISIFLLKNLITVRSACAKPIPLPVLFGNPDKVAPKYRLMAEK
jgi:hypothetical protein